MWHRELKKPNGKNHGGTQLNSFMPQGREKPSKSCRGWGRKSSHSARDSLGSRMSKRRISDDPPSRRARLERERDMFPLGIMDRAQPSYQISTYNAKPGINQVSPHFYVHDWIIYKSPATDVVLLFKVVRTFGRCPLSDFADPLGGRFVSLSFGLAVEISLAFKIVRTPREMEDSYKYPCGLFSALLLVQYSTIDTPVSTWRLRIYFPNRLRIKYPRLQLKTSKAWKLMKSQFLSLTMGKDRLL